MASRKSVKSQILSVLQHPEAEEGLFFRNFAHLHEVDERPCVEASDAEILEALRELIQEGQVVMEGNGSDAIFQLSPAST